MDFMDAMLALKMRKYIKREGWEESKYLVFFPETTHLSRILITHTPYQMEIIFYNPSMEDYFADDWVTLD